jgi:hypothetical protein
MIEYDCEGCGYSVVNTSLDRPPRSGFCAVCEWLCEFVPDPEEMELLRRQIDPPRTKS